MPTRGRPASKNPRLRRIETRINTSTSSELKFICEKSGLSITVVLDKAIHLLCLLASDSRTKDDTLYAIENIAEENNLVQAQWNQLFKILSDLNYRFPCIDEAKLSFICEENDYDSNEEALLALIDCEYQRIASQYSADEMKIWLNDIHGDVPEPNDDGILEEFEKIKLMTYI